MGGQSDISSPASELWHARAWAVTELDVLDEDSAPPRQKLEEALKALGQAQGAQDVDSEANAALAVAEARLQSEGPGATFQAAADEARQRVESLAPGAQTGPYQQRLLLLRARGALARRRPADALSFAERMLENSGEAPLQKSAARRAAAVAQRLAGAHEAAVTAAEDAIALGQAAADPAAEGAGLLCLAEARLASARLQLPAARTQISDPGQMRLAAMEVAEDREEAKMAERAARRALEIFSNLGRAAGRGRAAALEALVRTHLLRGQFSEAARLAEEQLASARASRHRRAEAGAWAALVLARALGVDPAGTRRSASEALRRLPTLGASGAAAHVTVALLAADSLRAEAAQVDKFSGAGGNKLDEAAALAQQALRVAREHGDFAAEVDALHFLTRLHKDLGMEPPRSALRIQGKQRLSEAAAQAAQECQLAPVQGALAELELEVEWLFTASDLKEAMEPLLRAESDANEWLVADEVPTPLLDILFGRSMTGAADSEAEAGAAPAHVPAARMEGSGKRLVLSGVDKQPMYSNIRVGGIQYGPRYRQVSGYRPPPATWARATEPVVAAVLRPSSDAEEWDSRNWDWNPALVDAAAHSGFCFTG